MHWVSQGPGINSLVDSKVPIIAQEIFSDYDDKSNWNTVVSAGNKFSKMQ